MKHLKTFESNNGPRIGDYVKVDPMCVSVDELQDYFKTAIGKLVDIVRAERIYYVHFDDVPLDIGEFICNKEPFRKKNIILWSKNKEDVEMMEQSNNYNL